MSNNLNKNKKILYVAFIREDSESLGFVKKVYAQCRALSKNGAQTYLYISRKDSAELYEVSSDKVENVKSFKYSSFATFRKTNFFLMKLKNLARFNEYLSFLQEAINFINPDKIYIRRIIPVTNGLISLVKSMKEKNIQVFYEYPDFPDIPWVKPKNTSITNQLKYIVEKKQVTKLKKYLYRIVAISVDESIVDEKIEIVYIRNGIDLTNMSITTREYQKQTVNLLGVANIGFWHAYDRIIKGIDKYYKEHKKAINVKFHIVGDGKEKSMLEQLVRDLSLDEHVIFYGSKNGEELNEIVNQGDIGIGILGNHRKELYGDSSLKNREYCARAIPFVIAARDLDFPDELPFVKRISADETIVDINEIVEFYSNLNESHPNFREEMRTYAVKNLQWEEKIKPIIHA